MTALTSHKAKATAGAGIYLEQFGAHAVRILPGETYTTSRKNEAIITVLGSCVAACIRDPKTGLGGMNRSICRRARPVSGAKD